MEKPWFKLNPNDEKDKWWLYTSIRNTKKAFIQKSHHEIISHLILKYFDNGNDKYRILTWFNNDPNRYLSIIKHKIPWYFNKQLEDMVEGEIVVNVEGDLYQVYDCKFNEENQKFVCKVLKKVYDSFNI